MMRNANDGFSLIELLVAMAVMLTVTSAVCAMLSPASGFFQVVPESADVRQRLLSATDAVAGDLLAAGALPLVSLAAQEKAASPPVFPMRVGRRSPDAAGTFDSTRMTLWYTKRAGAQTTLAAPLVSATGTATIALGPSCAPGDPSCGFQTGATVVVIDRQGSWDLFSVTRVQGSVLTLQHNLRDAPAVTYQAGDAAIAEVVVHTYQFKNDPSTGAGQLIRYDATGAADAPVVDHIVNLAFAFVGDAVPPMIVPGSSVWDPARSTYGPLPPPPGLAPTSYPPGENCVFARDGTGASIPRLATLGTTGTQVMLSASQLTDGPWCPDASSPNRYDADLLRIRTVIVSIRIEAAISALRGPAGPLFTRAGTARDTRLVPDREARLVVAMRSAAAGL